MGRQSEPGRPSVFVDVAFPILLRVAIQASALIVISTLKNGAHSNRQSVYGPGNEAPILLSIVAASLSCVFSLMLLATDVLRAMHKVAGAKLAAVEWVDGCIAVPMVVLTFSAFVFLVVEFQMMQTGAERLDLSDETHDYVSATIVFAGLLSMLWVTALCRMCQLGNVPEHEVPRPNFRHTLLVDDSMDATSLDAISLDSISLEAANAGTYPDPEDEGSFEQTAGDVFNDSKQAFGELRIEP